MEAHKRDRTNAHGGSVMGVYDTCRFQGDEIRKALREMRAQPARIPPRSHPTAYPSHYPFSYVSTLPVQASLAFAWPGLAFFRTRRRKR